MGVIQRDLKEGMRVFVEGYIPNDEGKNVFVSSEGYIREAIHIANNYVNVEISKGPNRAKEVCKVPVSLVFYIKQKK